MHVLLEIASALLAIIPMVAVGCAFRRTKSPRLALALLAFGILEARMISMVVIHTLIDVDHSIEEMIEFGGDLATLAGFSVAFLYGTRWWLGRAPAHAS